MLRTFEYQLLNDSEITDYREGDLAVDREARLFADTLRFDRRLGRQPHAVHQPLRRLLFRNALGLV